MISSHFCAYIDTLQHWRSMACTSFLPNREITISYKSKHYSLTSLVKRIVYKITVVWCTWTTLITLKYLKPENNWWLVDRIWWDICIIHHSVSPWIHYKCKPLLTTVSKPSKYSIHLCKYLYLGLTDGVQSIWLWWDSCIIHHSVGSWSHQKCRNLHQLYLNRLSPNQSMRVNTRMKGD